MFKTTSRKGFSLAAIVALGASLLAGTPALAAGEVNLETKSGTTYAALAGTTFQLQVNVGSAIPSSSYGQLKTKITNTGATTYSASLVMAAGAATSSGDVSNTTSATTLAVTTASSTNSAGVISVSTANSVSGAVLSIQSWLDADFDGVIDSGEFASDVRVVTFHKQSDIKFTTALTAPALAFGNSTLSAVVSTDKEINMAQLAAGSVKVAFATVAGTTYTASGAASHSAGVFNNGETASAVVGATTTAKAELGGISVSAGATYVAVAIVNSIEASDEVYSVVSTANVSNIDAPELTDDSNTTTSNHVRAGAAIPLEFTAAVSKSAGVKAAAGTLVTVTVTEGTLTSVSAVVGGGKTLANLSSTTSEKITFTIPVDADGLVTIDLAATLKADQTFTLKLSADNVETSAITVTAKDAVAHELVDMSTIGSSVLKIAKGATADLKWAALDQFGSALTGNFRIYLTGGVTASADVVAGAASFVVSPATTTTYTANLQKYNTSTLVYENVSISDTHAVTVGTSNVPAAVTIVASTASGLALNNYALKAADVRLGGTAPKVTSDTTNSAVLSGQVTDANGIATYGVVTLTAPNVMFQVGSVYTLGSVTIPTNASGAYSDVKVFSNTAGKFSVSAVVGSAKKDIALTYNAAADTAGAKWVSVLGPQKVLPGTTAQFKFQLLDTWSNPVKVSTTSKIAVTYTGPGFVTGTLPNTTDKDGYLSFSVLFGSRDEGNVSVTVSYDGDATPTTTADNVAATVAATVGEEVSEVNAVIGSFNGRWAVRVENAKGSAVVYKVGGRWFKATASSDNFVFSRKSRVGASVLVKVWVNGDLQNEQTITVK